MTETGGTDQPVTNNILSLNLNPIKDDLREIKSRLDRLDDKFESRFRWTVTIIIGSAISLYGVLK
jgi:hypothetical protein